MKNKITVEGTICGKKRPEMRFYPSGDKYIRFSIVWNGKINKKRIASFFNVVLHGDEAVAFDMENKWVRGQKVIVSGSLHAWRAQFSTCTDIACKRIVFLSPPVAPAQQPSPQVEATV